MTSGKKKNRAKLKRKKANSPNETVMNEGESDVKSSGSGNNLLYSVINTFRKPKAEGKGKKPHKDQQAQYRGETSGSRNEEEELDVEDDYEENEDDYAHYGANAASSLPLSLFGSLSLIVCALALGH